MITFIILFNWENLKTNNETYVCATSIAIGLYIMSNSFCSF